VAAVITAVSLTDMILYNRKKRREFYAEKSAERQKDLVLAREAFTRGHANEDQILLLNQERAAQEAALEKKNKPGVFKRARDWMFSGLSNEEIGAPNETVTVESLSEKKGIAEQAAERVGLASAEGSANTGRGLGILKAVDESRRAGEKIIPQSSGGHLDQLGEETAGAAKKSTKSWTEWALKK
jgi:hypothetical protein